MLLDTKLDFQGHLKSMLNKVNKTMGFLCKLHNTLPKLPLLTIYRGHLWGLILAMGISYAIGRGICAVLCGSGCGRRCGGHVQGAFVVSCGGFRGIWGWLWFSCGVAHSGRSLISVFQDFFASIKKGFILAVGLGTALSFYGV